MVVVLIIGILVAMAIPVAGLSINRAQERSCKANLRTLEGLIAQYQAEYGVWPLDIDTLVSVRYLKMKTIDPHPGATDYTIDVNGKVHANGPLDHVVFP
jgi:type II secretory pathway pseudopilin PulG